MLKRYIWILLSWMTHTDYMSIWWSARPAGGKPKAWAQGHKSLTRDYSWLMSLTSPKLHFSDGFHHLLLWFSSLLIVNFEYCDIFWPPYQSHSWKMLNANVWLTCFSSNDWQIPIGSDRKSVGWEGCWVSCNVELHVGKTRTMEAFSSITPSFRPLITSSVLFLLASKNKNQI